MISKILALTFVLLSTTSGWAAAHSSKDNPTKWCPLSSSWIQIADKTTSNNRVDQVLKSLGGTGVRESRTVDANSSN